MSRRVKSLLLALGFSFGVFSAWAQTTLLKDVLANPDSFDSKIIEIEGEVVGEVILTDKGAWVNIKNDSYNIGVFAQGKNAFGDIQHWGSYGQQGDWVKIKGVFNKDCSIHQISDLHLMSLEIQRAGHSKPTGVSGEKREAAIRFFIICLTTAVIYFIKVKYGKRATTDRRGV